MVTPCMPFGTPWSDPMQATAAADVSRDATRTGARPASERQSAYRSRLVASGLTQINLWVPLDRKAELCAEALRLRREAGLALPRKTIPGQLDLFMPDDAFGAHP